MHKIRFIIILIIALFITWYMAEGAFWLATLTKPMTPFMTKMEHVGIHLGFIALSIYTAGLLSLK